VRDVDGSGKRKAWTMWTRSEHCSPLKGLVSVPCGDSDEGDPGEGTFVFDCILVVLLGGMGQNEC
jgi:hypothetical protein